MIGETFNFLTVIRRTGTRYILCRCVCGAERQYRKHDVLNGKTKSCGCQSKVLIRAAKMQHGGTHGGPNNPEYQSWQAMRSRCMNPKAHAYESYGGRGIEVCERWNSFDNFLADMGKRPTPAHSLDRFPDHNGNYEPTNCRWATPTQQARNSRSFFKANGFVE